MGEIRKVIPKPPTERKRTTPFKDLLIRQHLHDTWSKAEELWHSATYNARMRQVPLAKLCTVQSRSWIRSQPACAAKTANPQCSFSLSEFPLAYARSPVTPLLTWPTVRRKSSLRSKAGRRRCLREHRGSSAALRPQGGTSRAHNRVMR